MYTVFHSYKDDELVRYALNAIDHPAVQEICSRLNNMSVELDKIGDLDDMESDLQDAENRIHDLENENTDLKEQVRDLECEVESLTEELKEIDHAV